MNALIGWSGTDGYDDRDGRSWAEGQAYRQYLKQGDFRQPALTYVTLDEQGDSINDGFFIDPLTPAAWGDIPASYHCGAGSFSFADGHAEVHKWIDGMTKTRTFYRTGNSTFTGNFGAKDKDLRWIRNNTTYSKAGRPIP